MLTEQPRTFEPATSPGPQEHDVNVRVQAEYREMPGLKLTLRQAARLFALELGYCERVLGALVEQGALAQIQGAFVRANAGRRHV